MIRGILFSLILSVTITIPTIYGDLQGSSIYTTNLMPKSILEAGKEYLAVVMIDQTLDSKNYTAVAGYAFQSGDKVLKPPMNQNVTEEEAQKFMEKLQVHQENFRETSTMKDSKNVTVFTNNLPTFVNFTFSLEHSGIYTEQLYYKAKHYDLGDVSSRTFIVVEKYSKAFVDDGQCKATELVSVIKHDYSTVVCVHISTLDKLKDRGWSLR